MRPLLTALRRARVVCVSVLLGAAAAGCGPDPFAPVARLVNLDTTVQVWALTGAPLNYPTVLVVYQNIVLRPDPSASFDLGFDIDVDGRLQVIPVSLVMTPLGGQRAVGFARPLVGYDAITEAPRTGWVFDETQTLDVGDVFVVRISTQSCAFDASQEIYAKFRVDSIFPAERRARLSGRINRNCGFRSFADSLPKF